MPALWRIGLLGRLCLARPGCEVVRFRTKKIGALLGHLAYHLPGPHPRETLCDLLWPEAEREASLHNLRAALSSLRRHLEPPDVPPQTVLLATRATVELNAEAVVTDVSQLRQALAAAKRAEEPAARADSLTRAVALYEGPLLEGYYEEWVIPERERLSEVILQALVWLSRHHSETGDLDAALDYGRRAVTIDPLREEVQRNLIWLYARAGYTDTALRHYRRLREALRQELKVDPDPRTQALAARIRAGRSRAEPLLDAKEPSAAPPVPGKLPTWRVATFLVVDASDGDAGGWHEALCQQMRHYEGVLLRHEGGRCEVALPSPAAALALAAACQKSAAGETASSRHGGMTKAWQTAHPAPPNVAGVREGHPPLPRIALHTGELPGEAGQSAAPVLRHAARLVAAAHPGQILVTEAAAGVARDVLPSGVRLQDLGLYRLSGTPEPVRIYQASYPGMPEEFPPPKAESAYASNLPPQLTRTFGRAEETAHLVALLQPPPARATRGPTVQPPFRLVTLTGAGGSGKTRLSLQAATALLDAYQGRVWFVPLADLTDAALVPRAIGDALGIPPVPGADPLELAADRLAGEPSLLLLDNCEQLSPALGPMVARLLGKAPALQVLATSRRRLGVPGERLVAVPPLAIPEGELAPEALVACPSVQLFVDRAQAVLPDFQVTPRNAPALAELCARLEGIPLALELVAARIASLTPAQMLERLGERLDWSAGRQRPATERHRTLRAAIEWGTQLLSPELQRLFARLSVFRGGWTLQAAEAVCLPEAPGCALDLLAQLQAYSLVLGEDAGEGLRYRMLETLREYAAERLDDSGEREELQRRHAEHFRALAEQAKPPLQGVNVVVSRAGGADVAEGVSWLERLQEEQGNLDAALHYLVGHAPADALHLAVTLYPFWEQRAHFARAQRWLGNALPHALDAPAPLRIEGLMWASRAAAITGDFVGARTWGEEALTLSQALGDKRATVMATLSTAMALLVRGDFTTLVPRCREAVAASRELNDPWLLARSLQGLGKTLLDMGCYDEAREVCEEGLRVARETGDRPLLPYLLYTLAHVCYCQRDYLGMPALLDECSARAQDTGDVVPTQYADFMMGHLMRTSGDLRGARMHYHRSFEAVSRAGLRMNWPYAPEVFAYLAAAEGQMERAARLLGAAEAAREELGYPLPISARVDHDPAMAALRASLDEATLARLWAEGRAMSMEQAIAYALRKE